MELTPLTQLPQLVSVADNMVTIAIQTRFALKQLVYVKPGTNLEGRTFTGETYISDRVVEWEVTNISIRYETSPRPNAGNAARPPVPVEVMYTLHHPTLYLEDGRKLEYATVTILEQETYGVVFATVNAALEYLNASVAVIPEPIADQQPYASVAPKSVAPGGREEEEEDDGDIKRRPIPKKEKPLHTVHDKAPNRF